MRAPLATVTVLWSLFACGPRNGTADSVVALDSLDLSDTAASTDKLAVGDSSLGPEGPSAPWDEARERGVDFRALGQEPGWVLEIDHEQSMYMLADYGERKVTMPAPAPRDSAGVTIYEGKTTEHHLTVHVRRIICHDAMSGFEMTHTVSVTLDGTEYRGCGRQLSR